MSTNKFAIKSLQLFIKATGKNIYFLMLAKLLCSLLPVLILVNERALINLVEAVSDRHLVLYSLAIVIFLNLLMKSIGYLYDIFWRSQKHKNQVYYTNLLEKSIESHISLRDAEASGFEMKLRLANNASYLHDVIGSSFVELVMSLFGFIAIGGVLAAINPALILLAFLSIVPIVIENLFLSKIRIEAFQKTSEYEQRKDYFSKVACSTETRNLNSVSFIMNRFRETLHSYKNHTNRKMKKECKVNIISESFSFLAMNAGFVLLGILFLSGEIEVGTYWTFSFVFWTLSANFSAVFNNIGKIIEFSNYVDSYFNFTDKSKRRPKFVVVKENDTILKNVSFTYCDNELPTLKNVNLKIAKGEKVGIVGYNGSGKTTLAKVILGLYPTKFNDVFSHENEEKLEEYLSRESKTAIFQNTVTYIRTLRENVTISNDSNTSAKNAENLLLSVGFNIHDVKHLDEGLDTMLAPDYLGGRINLSSGQIQMIQTARGLYRDHDFICLDEPTAAIDPIREIKMYDDILDMTNQKTAILISHRLASVRNVDKIVVLDEGSVAEIGTFDELLRKKGLFYSMWKAQSEWY